MAANKQASCVLVVQQAAVANGTETITVGDFAPDGCTIHGLEVQTQALDASGTLAVTGGGNTLFNTTAPANQNQCTRTAGAQALMLTATEAHLSLEASDTIVITRAGGSGTQSDIYFYYGDKTPTTVPVA